MLPTQLEARLAALLGSPPVAYAAVTGGYTPVTRAIATLEDGRRAYVKAAVNDLTAGWLRQEAAFYKQVRAPWLADLLGWEDGLLVLEDLGAAHWPPAWRPGDVEAVARTLAEVHATPPPPGLIRAGDAFEGDRDGWGEVLADPACFLSLGLHDAAWLAAHGPALRAAALAARFDGDALLHMDVRSDNLCFAPRGVVLIDWNLACVGNPALDLACWAPSLEAEGGPPPEAVLPGEPELAAWVAGYFAARAGKPDIPDAPRVRAIQKVQLRTALPWAMRALGR